MKAALCLLAFSACYLAADAQAPIPTDQTELGWRFGNTDVPAGEGTFIELFGDFQCPDTRDAWQNVFKELDQWIVKTGQTATVRYVPFPLPYHFNTYRAALSAIVTGQLLKKKQVGESDAFRAIANAILTDKQDTFQNAETANMTSGQIYEHVMFPIVQAAGLTAADKDAFLAGVADRPNDLQLRTSWKYGCSRAVTGTPVYAVNGVVSDEAAGWSLEQWKAFITGQSH
eukprot:TRINITY_DN27315_c0_g1_i1.p1 TRINITY_DN27315_c0_g1~~TRINITY_DN27315_c0_g1_i1.p1  ORF type:complete len:249 (+),score=116.38 TRINITY_DN27315_c0_g1_i1:63-749(+)